MKVRVRTLRNAYLLAGKGAKVGKSKMNIKLSRQSTVKHGEKTIFDRGAERVKRQSKYFRKIHV
jgi:hypothetical protein